MQEKRAEERIKENGIWKERGWKHHFRRLKGMLAVWEGEGERKMEREGEGGRRGGEEGRE